MTSYSLADLQKTLTPHLQLGKTRLETLCLLVLGMISARTVNLTHIAAERPDRAKIASTYRRLQRFFQHVLLPDDWSVGIVLGLIGNPSRWYLCMDRTCVKCTCQCGRRASHALTLGVLWVASAMGLSVNGKAKVGQRAVQNVATLGLG